MHIPYNDRAIASGALGALWLAGLWFAAPIVGSARSPSQRLALAMALGCLLPLGLGLFNLLYWWSLWVCLGVLVAARCHLARRERFNWDQKRDPAWDMVLGFGVFIALAWPVAVRPVVDGDTLIYHLPNAASWVAQHGIWTTGTRYWWYPPASELFASGLLATGGIGVVGLAGLFPAALLLLTIRSAAQRSRVPPVTGTLAACALLATPVAAVQLVSLQNDVWQAALFLCVVTEYILPAFGLLALTKPNGLLFAAIAVAARASKPKQIFAALTCSIGAVALWVAHDVILLSRAVVPIGTTIPSATIGTTIAAHIPRSLIVLAQASWHAGVVWIVFLALGFASAVFSREGYLRWVAVASIVLFVTIPTGYQGGTVEQLASGASLRFGLPLAALGALWLIFLSPQRVALVIVGSALGTVVGIAAQWRLFYNDATTHGAPAVAVLATLIVAGSLLIRDARLRTAVNASLCISLAAVAGGLARSHPVSYISNTYGGGFAFAAAKHFERIVTLGLPAGAAITADPEVNVFDGLDRGTCVEARSLDAIIVASAEKLATLRCGRLLYRDMTAAVVEPTATLPAMDQQLR